MDTRIPIIEICDLQKSQNWNPVSLSNPLLHSECKWHTVRLGSISKIITPRASATSDISIITLNDDGSRTTLSGYNGNAYVVAPFQESLNKGDVLVSAVDGNATIVADLDLGSLFSASNIALRTDRKTALALWAVLMSRSGKEYFASILSGTSQVWLTPAMLLDFKIPLLDDPTLQEIEILFNDRAQTRFGSEDVEPSWWHTADLRKIGWQLALASPHPELFTDGIPISELAITESYRFDKRIELHSNLPPTPNAIPVANRDFLRSNCVSCWASIGNLKNAQILPPGTVVVDYFQDGIRTRVISERMLLGKDLLAIDPEDKRDAEGIAAYLETHEATKKWRAYAAGIILPRMSARQLAKVRVPVDFRRYKKAKKESLDSVLERLLWT